MNSLRSIKKSLICLHVTSRVKFYPGSKDRREISTQGEISCFSHVNRKLNSIQGENYVFCSKIYSKFHPGVKMYRSHPGVKDAYKQKTLHPEAIFTLWWNNVCKLPLRPGWSSTLLVMCKQYKRPKRVHPRANFTLGWDNACKLTLDPLQPGMSFP